MSTSETADLSDETLSGYRAEFAGLLSLIQAVGLNYNPVELVDGSIPEELGSTMSTEAAGRLIAAQQVLRDVAIAESMTDQLTGLGDRRALEQYWQQLSLVSNNPSDTEHARRATESSSHYLVSVVDLRMFKLVNDTLGHTVGDMLLQQIAQGFSVKLKRSGDRVFRVGGDEFVIILDAGDGGNETRSKVNQWLLGVLSDEGDNSVMQAAKTSLKEAMGKLESPALSSDKLSQVVSSLRARYGDRFNEEEFANVMEHGTSEQKLEYILNHVGFVVASNPTVGDPNKDSLEKLIHIADRRSRGSRHTDDSDVPPLSS